MDHIRRRIVIGLPLASAAVLTGCGGGADSDDTRIAAGAIDEGRARALSATTLTRGGSLALTNLLSSSNFPGGNSISALRPSGGYACVNNDTLHLSFGDTTSGLSAGWRRGLQLALRKSTGTTLTTSFLTDFEPVFDVADGEITGLLVATAPLANTSQGETEPLTNFAYVPTSGTIQVAYIDQANSLIALVFNNLDATGAMNGATVNYPDFADQSSTGVVRIATITNTPIVLPFIQEFAVYI